MYLLDANALITANNLYYPIQRVPEFWEWLVHMGETGAIKIPLEILEEITDGSELSRWLKEGDNYDTLKLNEDVDPALVRIVINAYAPDLNDAEIIQVGRDPFLIAYALAHRADRIVVTGEVSKPSQRRANRKIPDVCIDLDVRWCDSFQMLKALDFRTSWRSK